MVKSGAKWEKEKFQKLQSLFFFLSYQFWGFWGKIEKRIIELSYFKNQADKVGNKEGVLIPESLMVL